MDHKAAYAYHIAAAIRAKKAMGGELGNADEVKLDAVDDELSLEDEAPLDPKVARKERIKAILAR